MYNYGIKDKTMNKKLTVHSIGIHQSKEVSHNFRILVIIRLSGKND